MGLQAGEVDANDAERYADTDENREYKARVIWYNRMDGFGFMALDGYPRDVLVHNTAIRAGDVDRDYLLKNDELRCKVGLHQGRPCCIDLVMVRSAG
jgi:cold shock CspA family protein